MNELVGAFGPTLLLWCVPLVPMFYTAVAAVVEGLLRSVAGRGEQLASAGSAAVAARRESRVPAS